MKRKNQLIQLVLLAVISGFLVVIVQCGGNSAGGNLDYVENGAEVGNYQEVKLTDDVMQRYLAVQNNLFQSLKEEFGDVDDEATFQRKMQAYMMAQAWTGEVLEMMEEQGFNEDEFSATSATIWTIAGGLMYQEIDQQFGEEGGLDQMADAGIAAMQQMLNNPMLGAEQKKELKKQIEEAKKNKAEMQFEHQENMAKIEQFDPENVKLVEKYLPRVFEMFKMMGQ